MAEQETTGLTISLLGKQHTIACPVGQEQALLAAADLLNRELDQFKARAHTKSGDKALLMVALNLCHQLLTQKTTQQEQYQQLIGKLLRTID